MIDSTAAVLIALGTAIVFVAAGVLYVRGRALGIEDYLVARGSAGGGLATATLVASVIGAWILFSPGEAGTWAGLVALVGYGIGQAAPLAAFVFVGPRMRALMPHGHSLTEYVWRRYGRGMHLLVPRRHRLLHVRVPLAAELTGHITGLQPPRWDGPGADGPDSRPAHRGLHRIRRPSARPIFTDGIQFALILPLLILAFNRRHGPPWEDPETPSAP